MKKTFLGSFAQEAASSVVAELGKSVFLELADAFLGKAYDRCDFLQVDVGIRLETIVKFHNLLFLAGKVVLENLGEHVGAVTLASDFVGAEVFAGKGVAEGHVAFFANRGVERCGTVAHQENLLDFFGFVLGKAFEALWINRDGTTDELAGFLGMAAEAAEHQFLFGADTDHAALFGDGACHILTHPPHGVADKLDLLLGIKAASGFDKAHIAFVDELVDVKALALVELGDIYNKTEIGFDQKIHSGAIALLNLFENNLFLFLGQQRILRDVIQVLVEDVSFVPVVHCLVHVSLSC